MVAVKGIFNGQSIQLLEKVDAKVNTKVVVTFLEEEISGDDTREITSQSNGFEFWDNPAEDIYQDFLEKPNNEDR
jgi:hypothetical protein